MMIIRRTVASASTLFVALALAGCSPGMKKTFGLEADPPNAYEVGTLPPLSLPPELGQLPAPNPGQPPSQQVSAAQQGANIVAPGNALLTSSPALSPAGQALLAQAGPAPTGNIRAVVNQNAAVASRSGGFVGQLMDTKGNAPTIVNADAEQRRLQENAALGLSPTAGATPQVKQGGPGLLHTLENLF